MNNYLFVAPYEEEWEYSLECLKNDVLCAFVQNVDDEQSSEFGNIGIEKFCGSLMRTY